MKVKTMVVAALACASTTFADNVEQIKNLPRGVQSVKYEKGVISTLVVVGKAAVPKALRMNAGRAAEYGGKKAKANAHLEFTRFLSTKCKWGTTSSGETAVAEAAASATDAAGNETLTETSAFSETEMTKEEKEQSAQACVSAIQVLWEGMNDSGEYAWVGAWNAKALNSLKGIGKKLNETHAEVDDFGQTEKAKRASRAQKELDAIKNTDGVSTAKSVATSAEGKGDATTAGDKGGKSGQINLLEGVKKPRGSVTSDANDFL